MNGLKEFFFTMILILNVFILPFSANAQHKNVISFNKAKEYMLQRNSSLENLLEAEQQAENQYKKALEEASQPYYNGRPIQFNDIDKLYSVDNISRIQLLKKIVLYPEQKKHDLLLARERRIERERELILGLRAYYQDLLSKMNDLKLKQKIFEFTNKLHILYDTKYNLGFISCIEMEELNYNLLKTQVEAEIAKRNYENACRIFNAYIGAPLDRVYFDAEYEELSNIIVKDIDFYIENAVNNSPDVNNLKREVKLKELEKEILEYNEAHNLYTSVRKEHRNLELSIKLLKLNIEKAILSITEEVKHVYNEITFSQDNIKRIENQLDILTENYKITKAKYNQGLISYNFVEQAELDMKEVELSLKMTVFIYNTNIIKLHYISGVDY